MSSSTVFLMALAVLLAVLVGVAAGWLFGSGATSRRVRAELREEARVAREDARREHDALERQLAALRVQADGWRADLDLARDERAQMAERATRVPALETELQATRLEHARALTQAEAEHDAARREASAALQALAGARIQLEAEQRGAAEKIALLQEAREGLSNQFKALANDILEEKSKRFAEQNQASLGTLLDPLRIRLADFQGKVEQFYDAEGKQRAALSQELVNLKSLNQQMSAETRNLTQALKGSAKMQGNWGEMILERVLEISGMRRGQQYDVQQNLTRDGDAFRPDVVIHLPGERKLIVDAKVSLVAYEESTACESDGDRAAALRRHLDSLRRHVAGLSGKRYEELLGTASPDFVVMFVPIEPAFLAAVASDDKLFHDAWEKNVMLVSPSTLLFVVRMVAHIWRQEQQQQNAKAIADRGAELYDKLSDFVRDLEKIGDALKGASKTYDEAYKRLYTGKGNAIRQAEMLRELGVKSGKGFPSALRDASGAEADAGAGSPPELRLVQLPLKE